MKTFKKIYLLLDERQRLQAFALLFLFLLMSLSEVIGIASIFPFMSLLANPQSLQTNDILKWGYEYFGFTNANSYLFFIGALALFLLFITNAIKALTRWITLKVSYGWGQEMSCKLFDIYLRQPYNFFLKRNSSDISKNVLSEVQVVTTNVIIPTMDIITQTFIATVVFSYLAYTDWKLSLLVGFLVGGVYFFLFVGFKKKLRKEADKRIKAQSDKFKVVGEAIQGIKNIKLVGYESLYSQYFKIPSEIFSTSSAKASLIGDLPKYALEVIAFGSILFVALYLLVSSPDGLAKVLPIMAVYAFSAYRLMPSMQSLYNSYTKIKFNVPIINMLTQELSYKNSTQPSVENDNDRMPFETEVRFQNVSFAYEGSDRTILKNVDVAIPASSMIGIVGRTGAGKTTFVDILLGLLSPSDGVVYVDGIKLDEANIARWQKNLSYVSQHIYLCDDTIEANIAFGIQKDKIDKNKVKQSADMARLSGFVEKELPEQYSTFIGENGIRLSGGQRQRIGLARAFYLDRPLLVLDEATSALDPLTEAEVMASIGYLTKKKTLIIISHKVELLKQCDAILTVKGGDIFVGNFDDLAKEDIYRMNDENALIQGNQL